MNDREKYWQEMISCHFDEAGIFEVWNGLPEETRASFVKGVALSHEMYAECSGHYEQFKGWEDPEIKCLKEKVAFYEKEAEEWQSAFRQNVAMRHRIHPNDGSCIWLQKDGTAEIRR